MGKGSYTHLSRSHIVRLFEKKKRIWFKHISLAIQRVSEFVLFNDTWSQPGHSVLLYVWSLSFLYWNIMGSDIRPHVRWAVSLVIADGYLIFLRGLCGYVWLKMLTLSPLRVERSENVKDCTIWKVNRRKNMRVTISFARLFNRPNVLTHIREERVQLMSYTLKLVNKGKSIDRDTNSYHGDCTGLWDKVQGLMSIHIQHTKYQLLSLS